jgi:hypothetical protein
MLNTDFSSSYPRPTTLTPFGGDSSPAETASELSAYSGDPYGTNVPILEPDADSAYTPRDAALYVSAVYEVNETDTGDSRSSSEMIIEIYRYTQREGAIYHATVPAVGDLVFFHNTHDQNGDARNNDWYTHVGLVESVDNEGTIALLSYIDGEVSRTFMNLERPDETRTDDDRPLNSTMRRPSAGDPPYTQYLASELFAGFGNLLGDRSEFLIIDDWEPGMSLATLQ